MIRLDWGHPGHTELFNALTRLTTDVPHLRFSQRLVLCEAVLVFVDEWLEQHAHGETFSYEELVEQQQREKKL